ncbi:MAG: hypothetical protein ACJ8FY_17225 [Gemmataceae bacterium]
MSDSSSQAQAPDIASESEGVGSLVASTSVPGPTLESGADRKTIDELLPAAQDSERLPTTEPLRIFISYRIDPDAPLASVLKRLIVTSIDPEPEVFVSGDGGLRPSNAGFKQQLQDAARSAKAFVAVITNASKDREWIFFEAGAAWGQNLMYAPVLIGARPEELPSTIGDYQALRGQQREDMERLIITLAELNGSSVRSHFGRRYQTFAKTLEQYQKGPLGSDDNDAEHESELVIACKLALKGETTEANKILVG